MNTTKSAGSTAVGHHPAIAEFADIIEQLGVTITQRELPAGWWGAYDHRNRAIYLRPGLAPLQLRSTLAHELGHAVHGHPGPAHDPTQEREAKAWAAERLIASPAAVAAAAEAGNMRGMLSVALNIMPDDLSTYADAHGAEMWAALADSDALHTGKGWEGANADRHRLYIPGTTAAPPRPTQSLRDAIEDVRTGFTSVEDLHARLDALEAALCMRRTVPISSSWDLMSTGAGHRPHERMACVS